MGGFNNVAIGQKQYIKDAINYSLFAKSDILNLKKMLSGVLA